MTIDNSISLFTLKNQDGQFIHYHPVGHFWRDTPNYQNATHDRDEAASWAFKSNAYYRKENKGTKVEVAELKLSWE
jgi:hypothetical protein